MSLKTYEFEGYKDWVKGVKRVDPFGRVDVDTSHLEVRPGDTIYHVDDGGRGLVIAIGDDQITILWSVEPADKVGPFINFTMPLVRRVFPQTIAIQLVSIQPMSQPSGLIFYMDYKYGDGSFELNKKCTEGPLHSRLMWRAWRCLKTRTTSLRSSLLACLRSVRGPKLLTPAPKVANENDAYKHLVKKRSRNLPPSGPLV